ncbi:hypothetical protein EZV62_018731 [Acer yangbiense]|uniref:Prolyl endopeptidase n=1 Tax=Acer yangbiense TaxID=1000413 RepID=A0A5C7HKP6_9ROSI|nr:hypothetical protein EZV62_018731 [Acer yangbiense]
MSSHSLSQSPSPPVAKKVEHVLEIFGDVRVNNYDWLRDDSCSDPEILSTSTSKTTTPTPSCLKFEDELFGEIKGRVKEDDISAPIRRGEYYYYKRRLVPTSESPASVHDTMRTGLDAPPERVILDENVKARDHSFYNNGAFKICIDPSFKASRLSLLDRGFIFAIAHIRGGGEMGRQWYENGKLLKKRNTFTDFIASAEYLIEKKYCSKEKLCIDGRSAGGLLIGAVLNMRPDLFKAAIAGVPFVDVVTTMLDPTIPLTTSEWEEWGDPRKEEFYFYMKSYSPVDNFDLLPFSYTDPRVMYSEPAKFVAKLRELMTDDNILLFKCELDAGHFSKSGRFERLQEDAFIYTFILKALNIIPASASGHS